MAHRCLIALLPLMLLSGCQAQKVLNVLTPTKGYDVATSIVYDDATGMRLDVYEPHDAGGAPVVIFLYGGRWQDGSKDLYRWVGQAMASRGYVAVLPNVRNFPEAQFPGFVNDAAKAVAWAHQKIHHYGGDPQRLFLMGHSSGAHIAALLALDERYLDQVQVPDAALRGMIGLAGPYDFLPFSAADLRQIFAPAPDPIETQPVHFARRNAPPLLLMHGETDKTVSPKNTANLRDAMVRAGGAVDTVFYDKMDHARLLGALAAPLRSLGDVLPTVDSFIRKHSGLPPLPPEPES